MNLVKYKLMVYLANAGYLTAIKSDAIDHCFDKDRSTILVSCCFIKFLLYLLHVCILTKV